MKTYHFFIIIFLAIILGVAEFFLDGMDATSPKPIAQVRVVQEDPIYDTNYVEDDNE